MNRRMLQASILCASLIISFSFAAWSSAANDGAATSAASGAVAAAAHAGAAHAGAASAKPAAAPAVGSVATGNAAVAVPGAAVAAASGADPFKLIENKVARGERVKKEDLAKLESLLPADSGNPYKRLITGEALSSLGLYGLASAHFEAADRSQQDYVLKKFKAAVDKDQYVASALFPYVQDVYPRDPALLYFAARRNMSLMTPSQEQRDQAARTARKELNMAVALPDPWPGTFASLAVLDYNEAALMPAGAGQDQLLSRALANAEEEIRRHPDEFMALKTKILVLCRTGKIPSQLIPLLKQALKQEPNDAGLNCLLARAYMYGNNYNAAIRPALTGLYYERDPQVLSDAKQSVFTLMRKADRKQLLKAVDEIASPGRFEKSFRLQLMRMRMGDLFVTAGDREAACIQYTKGLEVRSNFSAAIAYKLGYQYAVMHDYYRAFPILSMACRLAHNSGEQAKYAACRDRIARVGLNEKRDLALRLKMAIQGTKLLAPLP